jgi:DNA-binding response OmpR family regulator
MKQAMTGQPGGSNGGACPPTSREPIWILLERTDHQLAQLIVDALKNDGHRVVDGSRGMALLLNLVSLGLTPVAPEVAVVMICDAGMTIPETLAVLGTLREQGDYCPPFIPITESSAEDVQKQARRLGALSILTKPLILSHLRALVRERQMRFGSGR